MPIRSSFETVNGRTVIVERDADTDALMGYVEPDTYSVPRKERLERELRQRAYDLQAWGYVVTEAQARGETAGTISELQALKTTLYNRVRDTYLQWRTA